MFQLEELKINSLVRTPSPEGAFAPVRALRGIEDLFKIDGSVPALPVRRIGEQLLEQGIITSSALQEALAMQPRLPGRRLGWILVMLGRLGQEQLERFLATRMGVPSVSLGGLGTAAGYRARLPFRTSRRLAMALVHEDARTAWVAFADTTDLRAREAASFILGKRIVALHASRSEIMAFLRERDPSRAKFGNPYHDETAGSREIAVELESMPADSLDFVSYRAT